MIVNKKDLGNSKAQLQLLLSPSVLCGLTGGQLSSLANKSIAVRRVEACIQEVRRGGQVVRWCPCDDQHPTDCGGGGWRHVGYTCLVTLCLLNTSNISTWNFLIQQHSAFCDEDTRCGSEE